MLKNEVVFKFNPNSNFVRYFQYGSIHRKNSPAVIWHDGDMFWIEYDHYHRKDGPAKRYNNGTCSHYWRGEFLYF